MGLLRVTHTHTHSTTQQVVRVLFDILKKKDSPLRLTAAELLGKGFAAWRSSSKDTKALVQVPFVPGRAFFLCLYWLSLIPDTHYHARHMHNTQSLFALTLVGDTSSITGMAHHSLMQIGNLRVSNLQPWYRLRITRSALSFFSLLLLRFTHRRD